MSVVALAAVRSCGVTTLGLALAATWPAGQRVLLVEADLAGGTLAAAAEWLSAPGLVSLAAATRRADDLAAIFEHCQTLPGGVPVLAAPAASEQAQHALAMLAGMFAGLRELDADVLLDCGRLTSASADVPRLAAGDRVLLVARPRLADLHALGSWLAQRVVAPLMASGRLGLVLVGDGPYSDTEVTDALGVEVVARVPFDPETADALVALPANDRLLRRAPLVRVARSLAERLASSSDAIVEFVPRQGTRQPFSALRQWRTAEEPVSMSNGTAPDGASR